MFVGINTPAMDVNQNQLRIRQSAEIENFFHVLLTHNSVAHRQNRVFACARWRNE